MAARNPLPAFWKTTEELLENQKIPPEIPRAFCPFLCECGQTFIKREDCEFYAKKHLAESKHLETFHDAPTHKFPGPCAESKKLTNPLDPKCLLLAKLCDNLFCGYRVTNEDNLFFHDLINHNDLTGLIGRGFLRGTTQVLGMKHYLTHYRIHEPEYQRRLQIIAAVFNQSVFHCSTSMR